MTTYKHHKKCEILLVGFEEIENLGLRYITSFMKERGIRTDIEPYNSGDKAKILQRIQESKPIIVGFSLIFQRMVDDFNELITFLRQQGVRSHFTMGGHFPTIEYDFVLDTIKGLDSIIRCEGEVTLYELYRHIKDPSQWKTIGGFVFRENGGNVKTPSRPLIRNLDFLPFPVRNEKPVIHRNIGISTLIASRGCFFNCSFCSIHQFYSESEGCNRRSRSPKNVLDEMEMLFKNFQIRIFIFEDDDFMTCGSSKKQWIVEFIKGLKERNLMDKIIWRVTCRIDEIEHDLIKMMSEAGLISVYLGIESGNDEGLQYYNKRYSTDGIFKSIDTLVKLNMPFEFGFMLFNPETTFECVQKDIDFLKRIGELGEAVVSFTKMLPYAGTPVSENLVKKGRLKGSMAMPDYSYADSRLDWLQHFFTLAFHRRNFENSGLVERLRYAKLDSMILDSFYQDQYDAENYKSGIRELLKKANQQCIETMEMATRFMSERTEKQILEGWDFAQQMIQEEIQCQAKLETELDQLMLQYL